MFRNNKRVSKSKELKAAYEKIFESEEGKTVLFDLMDSVNITGSSVMDSQSYEPIGMAFRDGQKAIVHRILDMINTNPERYADMLKEKQNQQEDFFNEN